ncbi:alcohol dehydrogenase [Ilyonectria robusta]|uniref:alcohol dehydrogenase n=1 Tax=Ilyonectria robusta TaxID=1079257 RepID=UPI001E8EBA5F|nr:alcohol dehydrogenase [Ilyonectria robusta]KAH8686265.1 alcohol dehydrogenase [Ilyonectria robusta]
MPTSNRAVIYSEPGTLKTEVVELPIPKPGRGEVLVRLLYSGVCHTDIGFCMNHFPNLPAPTQPGQIGGHEGAGQVVAHGEGVEFPAIGSNVGIKYAADACLTCDNCLEGGESSCKKTKISGYFTPGTFQQYCLAPAHYVTPIPSGLDLAAAAPLMCGGITVYTSLRTAGMRVGDWVVISGAGGGLGHLAIQYAKALGGKVLAVDTGAKEELCRSLGANEFVDFTKFSTDADLAARVKDITSGGARVALMCASSSRAYAQAMSWLGFRGTVACVGIPEKEGALIPNIVAMVTDELRIIATKTGNRLDAKQCLELAASGGVTPQYQLRKMEDLSSVFEEIESGKIQGRVVLDLR